jgi:hypothetical protein
MIPSTYYRGVRTLHFPDGRQDDVRLWGGIAWPTLLGPVGAERIEGFACIVAEAIADRKCTVYEQVRWSTVAPEPVPGRGVERGLANHLAEWWTRYGCSLYCTVGRSERERETWEPQIRQCSMIQPQPQLREEKFDTEAAFTEVLTRVQAGQFRHGAGDPVDMGLQAARNDRQDVAPAVMAVAAALRGIRSLGITLVQADPEQRHIPGDWARVFGRNV